MNVRNCTRCGKLFNYVTGQPICMECRKNLEEKFKDVRHYIKRNPNANISEVAEANEVDIKQIRQWIREERLSFSSESAIGIECERCGKTIKTGRFCEECKKEVTGDLRSAYKKEEKVEENPFAKKDKDTKMRFLNKNDLNQ